MSKTLFTRLSSSAAAAALALTALATAPGSPAAADSRPQYVSGEVLVT